MWRVTRKCGCGCHFDLNAPNAELQKLVIAIDGPSKADIQIEVVDTDIYRVFYTCQIPGNYHISLTYDGDHISNSPYHLRLHTQPLQEQVVPLPLDPARATIEPIEFHVNTSCIVTVRPEVPCAVFQAYIQAPQGNINLPITVHKSAKLECYEIYFIPNTSGNHWLNISLNHVPIIDNPCRLTVNQVNFFVSKSPNDPSSGSGTFSVGINAPSTVFHSLVRTKKTNTRDKCSFVDKLNESQTLLSTTQVNASQAGTGLLLVGLYSSRGPAERLVIKRIIPSSPGVVYKVFYRVRTRGQYMLVILYGSSMQHVPGSPYLVIVE
ncbi:hypothetical protein I4U23_031131 [Adineta vaga]|nr:hypothetical protein I4U23_031131 [Adineta vaga]